MELYKKDTILETQHGFFGKVGGVSKGIFDSLNCGLGSSDIHEDVIKNREIVASQFNLKGHELLTLNQVHSNKCIYVEELFDIENKPEADAFVTDKENILLGVLTADCAPVLFSGQKSDSSRVIGAAHAGWKGAFSGVLENTLSEMQKLGAELQTISISIGPSILQQSYEVSYDFYKEFLEQNLDNKAYFKNGCRLENKTFDLQSYILGRLKKYKIRSISQINDDTYELDNVYFSYRRSTHKKEKDYGRQVSVIKI